MTEPIRTEVWANGEAYESYVGRWSRLVARAFLRWLEVPASGRWLDVGCGTGALARTILETARPSELTGLDPSEGFVAFARASTPDPRVRFAVADARALPVETSSVDAAVSGLVLNFVPEPERAVLEMARVTRPGGTVAAYVWDYAGQMQLLRHFWDAAIELDPDATALDEGRRFALCGPEALERLFREAGLSAVEVRPLDVPTHFRDFEDLWRPFLGGQGPAPTYTMALSDTVRVALRERLRARLMFEADGSITLIARAWAVRGEVPS